MLSVWLAVTCLLSALSFARWSVSMPFARCNLPSRFVFGHAIWHDKSWMVPSCQLFIRIACQCFHLYSICRHMHACLRVCMLGYVMLPHLPRRTASGARLLGPGLLGHPCPAETRQPAGPQRSLCLGVCGYWNCTACCKKHMLLIPC